jgi:hypothetical protein
MVKGHLFATVLFLSARCPSLIHKQRSIDAGRLNLHCRMGFCGDPDVVILAERAQLLLNVTYVPISVSFPSKVPHWRD